MTGMRPRCRYCLALALSFVGPAFAGVDDIFVDARVGRDRYNGESPITLSEANGPVRTLNAAFRRAVVGGRIILVPSNFPSGEQATLWGGRLHGEPRFPLVIDGNNQTMDGRVRLDPYSWERLADGYWRFKRGERVLGGLFGQVSRLERVNSPLSGPQPTLSEGQYAFWDGSFLIKLPHDKTPLDAPLLESRVGTGLVVFRADHVIVRNFRFIGFAEDGAQIRGPVKDVLFENCLFADCGRAGASVTTSATVTFENCHFERNGLTGLFADNHGRATLSNCTIGGSPKVTIADEHGVVFRAGGAASSLSAKPHWVPEGYVVPGEIPPSPRRRPAPREMAPPPQPEAPKLPPSDGDFLEGHGN